MNNGGRNYAVAGVVTKPNFKKINLFYYFLIIILVVSNITVLLGYSRVRDSLKQTFKTVTKTSLELVDNVWKPELKKTDNYTGILIMGIDSRKLQFNGEEFKGADRDIDSIMQLVINHTTGKSYLFSIPRDTGVTSNDSCVKQSYYHSINHIYRLAEDGNCEGGGVPKMLKYVTYITGFENQYFAVISYQAFKDIINSVGDEVNGQKGLFIDVPRNIQEYYPREVGGGFEAVYWKKGKQFITTDFLLKYARSRKASSDFDRAARQQQVIEALQKKILESDISSDPIKIYDLYQSFSKNALFSALTLDDIRAGIGLSEILKTSNLNKYVLDENFGSLNKLLTRPTYTKYGTHNRYGYYLSPVHWNNPDCVKAKDEYCKLKDHLRTMVFGTASPTPVATEVVLPAVTTTPESNTTSN